MASIPPLYTSAAVAYDRCCRLSAANPSANRSTRGSRLVKQRIRAWPPVASRVESSSVRAIPFTAWLGEVLASASSARQACQSASSACPRQSGGRSVRSKVLASDSRNAISDIRSHTEVGGQIAKNGEKGFWFNS